MEKACEYYEIAASEDLQSAQRYCGTKLLLN